MSLIVNRIPATILRAQQRRMNSEGGGSVGRYRVSTSADNSPQRRTSPQLLKVWAAMSWGQKTSSLTGYSGAR